MTSNALDSTVTISTVLKGLQGKFTAILAATLTDDEKLAAITEKLADDVQEKRVFLRRCAVDRQAALEPLEANKEKRKKMIQLGGEYKAQGLEVQLGQLAQEVTALDAIIAAQESTFTTADGTYKLAFETLRKADAAYQNVRNNGAAYLRAIQANREALAMRDQAQDTTTVDTSFLAALEDEMRNTQVELRADAQIQEDLDHSSSFSIDAELARRDAAGVDEALMAEFEAAAANK